MPFLILNSTLFSSLAYASAFESFCRLPCAFFLLLLPQGCSALLPLRRPRPRIAAATPRSLNRFIPGGPCPCSSPSSPARQTLRPSHGEALSSITRLHH